MLDSLASFLLLELVQRGLDASSCMEAFMTRHPQPLPASILLEGIAEKGTIAAFRIWGRIKRRRG